MTFDSYEKRRAAQSRADLERLEADSQRRERLYRQIETAGPLGQLFGNYTHHSIGEMLAIELQQANLSIDDLARVQFSAQADLDDFKEKLLDLSNYPPSEQPQHAPTLITEAIEMIRRALEKKQNP